MLPPQQRLKIAYTLLPPPLSALPAKYWTSISLLVHSYSVAVLFEELTQSYADAYELDDAPDEKESFIIGFLHDLGQKLGSKNLLKLEEWIQAKLEEIGYDTREASFLSKYVRTNPAETRKDPTYPDWVWNLLWLSDRMQGTNNPAELYSLVAEASQQLPDKLNILYADIGIPHTLIRTQITNALYNKLKKIESEENNVIIPISLPSGLIILNNSNNLTDLLELDWENLVRETSLGLPDTLEDELEIYSNCCKDKDCIKKCTGKSKKNRPPECDKMKRLTKRDCEKSLWPDSSKSAYEIVLIYYGTRYRRKNKELPILPHNVANQLKNITVKNLKFVDTKAVKKVVKCTICGMITPVAVTGDFLQFVNKNWKTEKWNRFVPPKNLNQLMQNLSGFGVCPLCIGESMLKARFDAFLTTIIKSPIPLSALDDLGKMLNSLVTSIGTKTIVNDLQLHEYFTGGFLDKVLTNIGSSSGLGYEIDAFSSRIFVSISRVSRKQAELDAKLLSLSGIVSTWGFYPLVIDDVPPISPSDLLLSYMDGIRPLYYFSPSDKKIGKYTPYVTLTLSAIGHLYWRKYVKSDEKGVPAVFEVLSYPPDISPSLLQYSSPRLYSLIEDLFLRTGHVA